MDARIHNKASKIFFEESIRFSSENPQEKGKKNLLSLKKVLEYLEDVERHRKLPEKAFLFKSLASSMDKMDNQIKYLLNEEVLSYTHSSKKSIPIPRSIKSHTIYEFKLYVSMKDDKSLEHKKRIVDFLLMTLSEEK